MLRIIFTVVLVAAIILAIVTVLLIIISANKKKTTLTCEGTITGFYENTSEIILDTDESKRISPIVTYQVDGKDYEFTANFYSASMKVGDKVEVLYNPSDCAKATLKKGLFFGPVITGILALGFISAYVIYIVLNKKGIL